MFVHLGTDTGGTAARNSSLPLWPPLCRWWRAGRGRQRLQNRRSPAFGLPPFGLLRAPGLELLHAVPRLEVAHDVLRQVGRQFVSCSSRAVQGGLVVQLGPHEVVG